MLYHAVFFHGFPPPAIQTKPPVSHGFSAPARENRRFGSTDRRGPSALGRHLGQAGPRAGGFLRPEALKGRWCTPRSAPFPPKADLQRHSRHWLSQTACCFGFCTLTDVLCPRTPQNGPMDPGRPVVVAVERPVDRISTAHLPTPGWAELGTPHHRNLGGAGTSAGPEESPLAPHRGPLVPTWLRT